MPEVRHRLKFLIKPTRPDQIFCENITARSRTPISLPKHFTGNATDLVNEDDFDLGLWQAIFDLVKANCRYSLQEEIMPRFFDPTKSKLFAACHDGPLLVEAQKKSGKAHFVMLCLNVTEVPTVRALTLAMYKRDLGSAMEFAKYAVAKAKLTVDRAATLGAAKTGKGMTHAGAFKVVIG